MYKAKRFSVGKVKKYLKKKKSRRKGKKAKRGPSIGFGRGGIRR